MTTRTLDGAQLRALSIRQPHVEAILTGKKRVEYRTRPTNIRGTILLYAGLGRYPTHVESEMLRTYGLRGVACDDLPRGVIVGSVDLVDCTMRSDGSYEWQLRNPWRATKLRRPKKHPQPGWFWPL